MTLFNNFFGTVLDTLRLGIAGITLNSNAGRLRIRNTANSAFAPIGASRVDSETTIRLNSEITNNYTIQAPTTTAPRTLLLPPSFPSTGNAFLRASSTGAMTALATPECVVRKNSAQTIFHSVLPTSLVWNLITYPEVITDNFSAWNNSTSSYTIPQTGWYFVTTKFQIFDNFDLKRAIFDLYINGSLRQRLYDTELVATSGTITTSAMMFNGVALVPLQQNDAVSIRMLQTSRNNTNFTNYYDAGNTLNYLNELTILRVV